MPASYPYFARSKGKPATTSMHYFCDPQHAKAQLGLFISTLRGHKSDIEDECEGNELLYNMACCNSCHVTENVHGVAT